MRPLSSGETNAFIYCFERIVAPHRGRSFLYFSETEDSAILCGLLLRPESRAETLQNNSSSTLLTRILVVDDHEGTREMVGAVLRKTGFTVLACSSGEEGLLTIARDPNVRLLITDIMMPGRLNGWRLAESSKALRNSLRIIYLTAFQSLIPEPGQSPGLGPLLPKPCAPEQLILGVRRALEMSPGPRRRD